MGLRIECWSRKGKNGEVKSIWWQWREKGRGGKGYYGGKFEALPPERQDAYWQRAKSPAVA